MFTGRGLNWVRSLAIFCHVFLFTVAVSTGQIAAPVEEADKGPNCFCPVLFKFFFYKFSMYAQFGRY
uniref:Uncharacterized protein n=1 Tax=Oryza nivara TaxID=4536 RepID=A0A0E0IH72_ORYNI